MVGAPWGGAKYNFNRKKVIRCYFTERILPSGKPKGNIDAELVLHSMIEYSNYDKAVIVSGDGDFYCLIEYLEKQDKLLRLIIPNRYDFSSLLRKFNTYMLYMNGLKDKLYVYTVSVMLQIPSFWFYFAHGVTSLNAVKPYIKNFTLLVHIHIVCHLLLLPHPSFFVIVPGLLISLICCSPHLYYPCRQTLEHLLL